MTDADVNRESLLASAGGPRKKDDLLDRLTNPHYDTETTWDLAQQAAARIRDYERDADRLRLSVETLQSRLRWRDESPGTTHYPECWRDHYACAMAEIASLRRMLDVTELACELNDDALTRAERAEASLSGWQEKTLRNQLRADKAEAERDTIRQINNGWAAECEKLTEERDALRQDAISREPTHAMCRAADDYLPGRFGLMQWASIWRVMYDAAIKGKP